MSHDHLVCLWIIRYAFLKNASQMYEIHMQHSSQLNIIFQIFKHLFISLEVFIKSLHKIKCLGGERGLTVPNHITQDLHTHMIRLRSRDHLAWSGLTQYSTIWCSLKYHQRHATF